MSSTALKNTRLVAALLAAGAIGGAGVGAINILHSGATAATPPAISAPASTGAASIPMALPDFSQITERYGPAVVNISVTGTTKVRNEIAQGDDDEDSPFSGDPFFEFFKRFQQGPGRPGGRGGAPQEIPTRGQGSGFIVSAD